MTARIIPFPQRRAAPVVDVQSWPGMFAANIERLGREWAAIPDDHPMFDPGRRLLARMEGERCVGVTAQARAAPIPAAHVKPRSTPIEAALATILSLPPAALADVVERLIDRLDADTAADTDLEAECDACPAGDDDPASSRPVFGLFGAECGPGDPSDGEAEWAGS